MGKDRVISVLCRRDGIPRQHAEYLVDEVIRLMEEANFAPFECEEIMMNELGLEMDYIFDLLL